MCLKRLFPARLVAASESANVLCGAHMYGKMATRRCIIILVSILLAASFEPIPLI